MAATGQRAWAVSAASTGFDWLPGADLSPIKLRQLCCPPTIADQEAAGCAFRSVPCLCSGLRLVAGALSSLTRLPRCHSPPSRVLLGLAATLPQATFSTACYLPTTYIHNPGPSSHHSVSGGRTLAPNQLPYSACITAFCTSSVLFRLLQTRTPHVLAK